LEEFSTPKASFDDLNLGGMNSRLRNSKTIDGEFEGFDFFERNFMHNNIVSDLRASLLLVEVSDYRAGNGEVDCIICCFNNPNL
jgi:hypothetical protein